MEIEIYLKFLAALAAVLVLIAACAWAARRFGLGGALAATKGKAPRLAVVEVRVLDSRRKLVLLRRDTCEHLVLLGPNRDLLIESGAPPAWGQPGGQPGGEPGTRKTPEPRLGPAGA